MQELATRLDQATDAMVETLGPAVAAGEPWALTDVDRPGPESQPGSRRPAHVAEMLPVPAGRDRADR